MSITITIDGKKIETEEGLVLHDVAADNGIFIPLLCYKRSKPALGTCRACSVRVNGAAAASCTVRVLDGMEVEVAASDLADQRRALVELLFAEGLHNCPSCEKSGRCVLQGVGYEVEMVASRFPYRFPVRPRESASQKIFLERDRCIFCQRCVEFIRDQETGQKIFAINSRGTHAEIDIDVELADRMPPEQVREAADICPVGCILDKTQGYDDPIGLRKFEISPVRARVLKGEDI